MAFIYKTINTVTNKIYIGKSKFNNPDYLGSGLKIVNAIKKYGKECFIKIILEECSVDVVNSREIYWIQFFNSTNESVGYNISKGGEGGSHYWETLTEEEKILHNKKISNSKRGKSHKPHTTETKQAQSKSFWKYIEQNPNFLKERALAKCKQYTCVNHYTKEIYITANLKEFCLEHQLNKGTMQHNARTRKTLCNVSWSCREGMLVGSTNEIIQKLEQELLVATTLIKEKLSSRDKHGSNNPMFGKKHSDETKEKIKQAMIIRWQRVK